MSREHVLGHPGGQVNGMEPGISKGPQDEYCPARSRGGWHCCLPLGHDGNHIGTTEHYGSLYQWRQEDERVDA